VNYLFVSDLHYALKQLDWVHAVAQNLDLVIIGGDLLDIAAPVDARAQILVILKYLQRLSGKTQVIVCSGNHDLDARGEDGEKYARWIGKAQAFGVHTDGSSLELGDTRFTVCPWWDGPKGREAVAGLLARDAAQPKKRWVWVYHSPPDGSPTSWVGKRHIGDKDLVGWIGELGPDLVLTGHIHQSPFAKDGSWVDRLGDTWVFNPGRQIGPSPTRILVDDDRMTALWVSLAGAEVVRLNEPLRRPVAEATELPTWLI
jgi:Icc-related predicted phosphoesterase